MLLQLPLKKGTIRTLLFFMLTSLVFFSCRDGGDDQPAQRQSTSTSSPSGFDVAPLAGQSGDAGASADYHYICVNNCEGSGANEAGPCPVCGEELVHNTSFHANEQGGAANAPQILGAGGDNSPNVITLPEQTPSNAAPTQGASGEFHYTCSAGCGGGGNAQGACPSCGAELVHNAAFHANTGLGNTQPGTPPGASSGQKYPSIFNSPSAPRTIVPGGSGAPGQSHYICSAGCGGGGSSQGSCPSCGAALVHNDAFH